MEEDLRLDTFKEEIVFEKSLTFFEQGFGDG